MILYNATKGTVISSCVLKAYTMHERLKGLLGRKNLEENCSMHLKPCNSIHTFFMQFPIDVLFLDSQMKIVYIMENVGRNRMSPIVRKAHSVIELPSGRVQRSGIQTEDFLVFK